MTVVKTIGTGAGLSVTPDYATVALWESYLNGLGAFADHQVGRVLWASSANELTGAPFTFDGSSPGGYTIILEAGDANGAAGGSFRNNANKLTNALRYNASNGAAIRITSVTGHGVYDANVTLRYLQFKMDIAYHDLVNMESADAGRVIDSCIFCMAAPAASSVAIVRGSQAWTITNSLLYYTGTANGNGTGSAAYSCISVTGNPGGVTATNCTCASTDTSVTTRAALGKDYTADVMDARNIVCFGLGDDYKGVSTNLTLNNIASDQASGLPVGSGHQYSVVGTTEFESVTMGSEDFRLKSTSVKCLNNGTNTSAPALDIIGQTRS